MPAVGTTGRGKPKFSASERRAVGNLRAELRAAVFGYALARERLIRAVAAIARYIEASQAHE